MTLPKNWAGYRVMMDQWAGKTTRSSVMVKGPMLFIRSPEYTDNNLTEDIPIIVCPLQQWDPGMTIGVPIMDGSGAKLTMSRAHLAELGRNSVYVFARCDLLKRPGFEDVEQILSSKCLQPIESIGVKPTAAPCRVCRPRRRRPPLSIATRSMAFDFSLPADWEGYAILNQNWAGTWVDGSGKPPVTGPEILLRSPKWTVANPTQDIPIMIFTPDEWNAVSSENLAVSAAPIPPSELGRNSKYVFALPARYNFAFLPGYEEVEKNP